MIIPMFRDRAVSRTRQSGAALVVALVFLIALTLLGLASMGSNSLQQNMTYGVGEANLAFQGAESALSGGERWIESTLEQPAPDCQSSCATAVGIFPSTPLIVTTVNIRDAAGTWWPAQGRLFGAFQDGVVPTVAAGLQYKVAGETVAVNSSRYPRYVIEDIGVEETESVTIGRAPGPIRRYYRVTARAEGASGLGTPTIVQSVYVKRF